jgi:hypothetical protein
MEIIEAATIGGAKTIYRACQAPAYWGNLWLIQVTGMDSDKTSTVRAGVYG